MSKMKALLKASTVLAFLILSSSAFADIEPMDTAQDLGTTYGTDDGLGAQNPDMVQDLDQDQNVSGDTQKLSGLFMDKISTTQAMHAGDDEVSEPVANEY
jgi:hypothetical protein